jgi:hypothetical protein
VHAYDVIAQALTPRSGAVVVVSWRHRAPRIPKKYVARLGSLGFGASWTIWEDEDSRGHTPTTQHLRTWFLRASFSVSIHRELPCRVDSVVIVFPLAVSSLSALLRLYARES